MISEMIVRCDVMWFSMEGNAKKFRTPMYTHILAANPMHTYGENIQSSAAQRMKSKWKSNRIERCSTNEYLHKVVFIVTNEIFHCIVYTVGAGCAHFVRSLSLSASHASMGRAYARAHTHERSTTSQECVVEKPLWKIGANDFYDPALMWLTGNPLEEN